MRTHMIAPVLVVVGLMVVGSATVLPAAPLPAAVLVLDARSTSGALSLSGNSVLTVQGGNVIVNACHNDGLFNANSRVEAKVGAIRVCGGAHRLGSGVFIPDPETGSGTSPDPYARVAWPSDGPVASARKLFLSGDQERTLSPGVYVGGLSCTGRSLRVTLRPGLYVITNGDLFVSGATLTGQGVTIIMAGDAPGKMLLANNCNLKLSAPREGPLKDLVLVSWRVLHGAETDVAFSSVTATLDGVVYVPQGSVGLSANAKVTAGAVLSYGLSLNTGATLDVLGQR